MQWVNRHLYRFFILTSGIITVLYPPSAGGNHVRDTNSLRSICSAITHCRDSIPYRLLCFWEPLMHKVLLGAYEIWVAEECLPNLWPDDLIYQNAQQMSSMQRAKALAWSVLLGPKPKDEVTA